MIGRSRLNERVRNEYAEDNARDESLQALSAGIFWLEFKAERVAFGASTVRGIRITSVARAKHCWAIQQWHPGL